MSDGDALATTRRALHGVAELVLAGPQYRRSGTIRLRITPGGFGTVREPALRVEEDILVAGDRRVPLAGGTYADLGAAVGVEAGAPADLYHDGSGVPLTEAVHLDLSQAGYLAATFALGDAALRALAPPAEPVLWPEHFDVSITLDEVNYGVSPGDGYLGEPYAYVGPYAPRSGAFWNAPFGAARPLATLGEREAVVEFFTEGRTLA
jgi:hypothetical protein